MTGMKPWNHGFLSMAQREWVRFPATLPQVLSRNGYHTQAVGKMHFTPARARYGFDHMVLDESSRGPACDYRQWFETVKDGQYSYNDHSLEVNSWMGRPSHLPEHLHPTYWTATEGIRFLRNRDPMQPFFMWLSFDRPHSPYDPPEPYYSMYSGCDDIPPAYAGDWSEEFRGRDPDVNAHRTTLTEREFKRARAAYYGSITFIDHQIGRLLQAFRKLSPEDAASTFIVFTSDHGDMLGDHHHWRKGLPYEGSTRIPMVMRYPSGWDVPAGGVSDQPVELRDIMPTLLDAAGVEVPESVDGDSMLKLARGNGDGWRDWLMAEYPAGVELERGWQAGISTTQKYIWFHHSGDEMLFDLANDPGETANLADRPESQEALNVWRQRLAGENESRGDPRGKNGKLVVQPIENMLPHSPNYERWRMAALEHFK